MRDRNELIFASYFLQGRHQGNSFLAFLGTSTYRFLQEEKYTVSQVLAALDMLSDAWSRGLLGPSGEERNPDLECFLFWILGPDGSPCRCHRELWDQVREN